VALRTTCIKNIKFKIIKIRIGCPVKTLHKVAGDEAHIARQHLLKTEVFAKCAEVSPAFQGGRGGVSRCAVYFEPTRDKIPRK